MRLNQLLSVSSRLWVGGRWHSNATLRAYVGKDRLDDIEVGDLGTLSDANGKQWKNEVVRGNRKRTEEDLLGKPGAGARQ